MARYRIPGKNYSRRSIFGITAIVVVVAAIVAAGVAVAVLPTMVDGLEGSEFVTDGGYTRPVVTAIVLENDGQISVNANLESVFATVQYSDGSTEQVALSEMVIEGLDLTAENVSSGVVLNFGGFEQRVDFTVIPTTLTVTYIAGEGGSIDGDLVQQVIAGQDATTVRAVPNAGYEFVRWTDGYPEEERRDRNISKTTTLQAVFTRQTFTVVFFYPDGTTAREEKVQYGMNATDIPDPDEGEMRMYGYRFAGWDASYEHITQNMEIHPIMVKHAIDLNFTATQDANGNLGGIQDIQPYYPIGEQSVLRLSPNTEREFLAWNITDMNGNVVTIPKSVIAGEGYNVSVSLYDSISVTFTAGQTGTEGRNEYTLSFTIPETAVAGSFEIDIHADFAYSTSVIAFTSAGATGNIYTAELDYGTSVGTLFDAAEAALPVRNGYTFVGWYHPLTAEILDGDEYITMDTTLTAYWTTKFYEVTFILDDVIGNISDFSDLDGYFEDGDDRGIKLLVAYSDTLESAVVQTVDGVEYGVYPEIIPERTGYVFEGWYLLDVNGALTGSSADRNYRVGGETAVRARFTPRTISLTPVADGGAIYTADNVPILGTTAVPVTEDFAFRAKPALGYVLGDITLQYDGGTVTLYEGPGLGEDGYFNGVISSLEYLMQTESVVLTVEFVSLNHSVGITVSGGNGEIAYSQTGAAAGSSGTVSVNTDTPASISVPSGSSVTLNIAPASLQQRISAVAVDNVNVLSAPQSEYTLILENVTADKNVEISFENVYYSIQFPDTSSGAGADAGFTVDAGDVTPVTQHLQGSDVTFTVTAEPGKYLSAIRVNGTFMDVYNRDASGITAYCRIEEYEVNYMPAVNSAANAAKNAPANAPLRATENDYRITSITFTVAGVMQNTVISVAAEDIYYYVNTSVTDGDGNAVAATLNPGSSFTVGYRETAVVSATVANTYYISEVLVNGERVLAPTVTTSALSYTTDAITNDIEITYVLESALHTITFMIPEGVGIDYNGSAVAIDPNANAVTFGNILKGSSVQFRVYTVDPAYQLTAISRSISYAGGQGAPVNEVIGFRVSSHNMTFNAVDNDYEVEVETALIDYTVDIFAVNHNNMIVSIPTGDSVIGTDGGGMLTLEYAAVLGGGVEIEIQLLSNYALETSDVTVVNASGGDYTYSVGSGSTSGEGYYYLSGTGNDKTLYVGNIGSDISIYLNVRNTAKTGTLTFGVYGAGELTARNADGDKITSGYKVTLGEDIEWEDIEFTANPTGSQEGARADLLGFLVNGVWTETPSSESYVYEYKATEGDNQVFAVFGEVRWAVIIESGIIGGDVMTDEEWVSGTNRLTVRLIPDEGYMLVGYSLYIGSENVANNWDGIPSVQGEAKEVTFDPSAEYNGVVTVTATFEQIEHTVTVANDDANGTVVSATGDYASVPYGSEVRLNIGANTGYFISSVVVNGLEYGAVNLTNAQYNDDMRQYTSGTLILTVTIDTVVEISYMPGEYTLTIVDNPGGTTYAAAGPADSASPYADVDSLSFSGTDVINLRLEAESGYHIESIMINGEIYDEWLASSAGIEDEVRQLLLTLAAGDDLRGQGNVDIDVRYAINTYELSLTAVNTSPNFAVYDDDPVDFGTVTVFGETPDASGKYADVDHGSNVLIVFAPVLSKHYYIYSITVNGTRLGADAVPATGGNYLINVTDDVSVTVEYKREAYSYSLLTSFSDDMDEIVQSEGNSWNGVLSMAFRNPYDSSIEVKSENGTYEYGLRYVLTANAGTGYFVESLTVNGEERSQYLGSGSTLMGTLSSNLDIESVFMIKFHTVEYSAVVGTDRGTVLQLNIVGRDGITVVNLFSDSVREGAVLPLADGGIVRITEKIINKIPDKDEEERIIRLEVSYGSLLEFVGSPNFEDYGEAVAGISLRSGNNAINVTLPTEGEAMNLERTVVDDTVLRVTFDTVRYDFIVTSSTGGRIELSYTVDDDNTVAWDGTVNITLTLDEGYELAAGAVAVSVNGTFDQSVSNAILKGLTDSGRYGISGIRSDYVITITPTRKHIDGAFTGNYKISHGSNVADSRLQIAKEGGATFGTRFDGTLNNDGAFIATDQSGRYIGILYNDSVNISLTPIEGYVLSTVTVTMTMEGGEIVTYGIGHFSNISGTAGKTLNIPAVKGDLTIYVEYAKNEYSLNITVKGTAYGEFSGGTITGESGDSVAISGTSGLTVQHYDGLSLMFSARFGYYASSFEICGMTMDIGVGSDYVVNVEKNGSSCYVYTATFDVTASMLNNRSALDVSVTFSAQQYDLRIGYRGTAGEYVTASTEYGRLSYTSGGTGTLLNYSVAAGYEIVNAEIFDTAAWSSSSARAIGILTRIDALTENRSPVTNEYLSRPRVGAQTYQLSMRIDIGKVLEDANLSDSYGAASIIEAMNIHSGNRTVYLIFSAALSVYDMGFDGAYVVWPDSHGRAVANAFATTASGNLMIGNTPYLSYTTRFEYQSGSDGTNLNDHRHGTVAEMTVVVNESGSRSFRFEGIQEFVNGAWVYRANGEAGMTIDDAGSTITVSYTMESTRTFRIIFYEIFEVALEMTPLYKYMGGSFASGLPGSLIYNTYANISAAANYEGIETDDGADYNDIYPNVPGNYEVLNGVEERAGRMLYSVRCGATILPAAVDNTNSSTVQKADISFYYAQAAGDDTILENALPDGGTTVTRSETYYGADKAMRLLLSISFATEGEAINTAGGNIVGADVADGSITVNPGSTLNLTVQPDAGYRLGAVGYLPDTGTPGVNGRRVFLNDYVMYDVVAGSSIDNAELPFKLTPATGNNYTMSFDKISEGMVIRIVFIKQVSVTREIQLLDGYVPPTFYSVFGWTNSTGVTEWTNNADGSQTAVVDYGTAMGMQISDAITASNTGNNVRYRFVGYLINGVMQDNSLSRAYPSSTVGNFVISDTTMNGAEIEGMSGNFTVDIVALYQPIYTIIIDNLYYDSESGTYMDPGSIAVRTYPYNSTRIQYYQSYDEIPAYVSGGSGGNGKYIFRVSGGINGSTGTSYNQWSDNTITLSWLQGGSSAGFGLFSWEVYAYNRDTASWEWKALSANNNYTFNVNSLYNDSYYMYLNAQNAIEGGVPENYLSGITNYTDSESGYVYGVPVGGQTLYDNYCIMIRPHYQKRNIIKVIPEVAEISAGAYIPYDDLTVRVPPVRPSIGSGSGNSLETGILQGNTVTISPNVTGSYIFDGWLYQVRGTDGEPTGQPFEPTDGATVGVTALNRDGEEVTLRYSLDADGILRIIMDDHFTIYARYTQMHNISVSATNISSSSFATALPKLNLSYKESVTATETVALIKEGVPTEELQKLGFTFEDGVFNGTLKVGSILYASLSMNGVSTAFGAVDGFNPRYDRLSDVHVYVNNDDAFGTSDPELSNYDDSDVETIRDLQTLQAYISGASLNDGNYAEYTGMLSDFSLEITANIAKRVRFDFISYGEINIGDFYKTDSENSTAGIKLPLALSSAMGYDDVLWVYDGGEIDADGAVNGNIRLANVPLIGGNSYDGSGIPTDMDFWLRIDNGTNIITLDNSDLPGMGISFGTGSGAAIGTKICNVSMYGTENSVFTELPFVSGDGSGSNPFLISTYTQLMNIDRVYKGTGFMNNVTFMLENDIVIPQSATVPFRGRLAADTYTVDENRLDMGFTGTFIGDGYGIYNLAVISEEDYTGLFSKIGSGGRVEDLYLSGQIQSESASYVGMLAGYVEGADIENVKIVSSYGGNTYENMVVGDIYVGGLVGYITGTSDADTASIAFYTADTAGNSRDYVIDGMIVIANTGGEYDNSSKEYRGGAGGIAGAVGPFASVTGDVYSADQQDFGSIQPLSALRDVVVSAESAYGSLIGSIEAGTTAITDEMMQMAVYGFVIEYSSGGDSTQEGIAAVGGAVGFVGANSVLGFVNVEIPSGESQLGGAQAAQNVYSPTLNVVHSWGSGGIVGKNAGLIQYCNVTGDGLLSGEAAAMGGIVGVNFGKVTNCTFSARLKSNRGAIGGSVGTTSSLGGIAGINWSGASIENSGVSGNKGEADYITEPTLEVITLIEVYNVEANGGMGNGLYAVYTNDDMTNIYVGLAVGYNGSNSFVNGGTFTGKIMVNRRSSDISTGATYIGGAIGYNDSNTASSVTTDVNIFFFHYMYVDSSIPVDENTTTEYLVQHLYVGGIYGGNGGTSTPGGSLTATIAAEYLGGGAAVSQDDLDQSSWSPSNAFMTGTNIGQAQVHNSGGTLRTGCQMPNDPSGERLEDWFEMKEKGDYTSVPKWVLDDVTTVNVNWTTWWKGYMYGGNGRYVQISVS